MDKMSLLVKLQAEAWRFSHFLVLAAIYQIVQSVSYLTKHKGSA